MIDGTDLMQELDELSVVEGIAARRRSVRGFRPEAMPDDMLRRVLQVALATPSNCNTQPWTIYIVRGEKLRALSEAMIERARRGEEPDYDIDPPVPYPGEYRERQIDAARRLFEAQGIGRHDVEGRMRSLLRNYAFFGAPHIALFCVPAWAGPREFGDAGMIMQSFMTALAAAGIGSCPQGALGGFSSASREILGIEEGLCVFAGVSFGYEDITHETAEVRPPRRALDEVVRFR